MTGRSRAAKLSMQEATERLTPVLLPTHACPYYQLRISHNLVALLAEAVNQTSCSLCCLFSRQSSLGAKLGQNQISCDQWAEKRHEQPYEKQRMLKPTIY